MASWDITPLSPVGRYQHFWGTYCENGNSYDMLAPVYQSTMCHISDDHTLNMHCCKNLTFQNQSCYILYINTTMKVKYFGILTQMKQQYLKSGLCDSWQC
jgi:hypothetical protein